MLRRSCLYLAGIVVVLFLNFSGAVSGAEAIYRYSIVVGANNGGYTRTALRFAVSDAGAFMNVLTEMGGVDPENGTLLFDPDKSIFYSAFQSMRERIAAGRIAGKRVEFFFYYSGHSDEEGIMLGNDKIPYGDLKKIIEQVQADFRIAILDSCSSGSFTRVKGGIKKPPFLFDLKQNMKGSAILTSSSIDEVSQESEKIKGSFFTYYLITGLRGAADVTQDNRITLNEVYQYAYNETLLRTTRTSGGAQHPSYNIQMTGMGDLVITDVRKSPSRIILARNLAGKFFIHDKDNILVSEFNKAFGRKMDLGIESGDYTVINQSDNRIYEARIKIQRGESFVLDSGRLIRSEPELTYNRGEVKKESVFSGEKKYLLNPENIFLSGYGSPNVSFSKAGTGYGVFVGGQGGLIINDRFVIGAGGYGLTYPQNREKISGRSYTGEVPRVQMGYGGGLLEYYFSPHSLTHLAVSSLIGGGSFDFQRKMDKTQGGKTPDNFFVFEPGADIFINLTSFCRIGFGTSYRYINGLDKQEFSDKDFRGFNFIIKVAFGRF